MREHGGHGGLHRLAFGPRCRIAVGLSRTGQSSSGADPFLRAGLWLDGGSSLRCRSQRRSSAFRSTPTSRAAAALLPPHALDGVVQDGALHHPSLDPSRSGRASRARASRSISAAASGGGRSAPAPPATGTSMTSLSASSARRSMTLRSSRTLPGHWPAQEPGDARASVKRSLRGRLGERRRERAREIVDALGERGQRDGHDVEPVEEVLAEAALGDALLQVDVGRRRRPGRAAGARPRRRAGGSAGPRARAGAWPGARSASRRSRRGGWCRRPRARAGRGCGARRR